MLIIVAGVAIAVAIAVAVAGTTVAELVLFGPSLSTRSVAAKRNGKNGLCCRL